MDLPLMFGFYRFLCPRCLWTGDDPVWATIGQNVLWNGLAAISQRSICPVCHSEVVDRHDEEYGL